MYENLNHKPSQEIRAAIERLQLSPKTLTIDVNGTLIPDDLQEPAILDSELLAAFQAEVARLKGAGWDIGLNSDSPWEVLAEFAAGLGLPEDSVIIAEGGNVVSKGQEGIIFRQVEDRDSVTEAIRQQAVAAGYTEVSPCKSPEFGGAQPDFSRGEFAFGAGRLTSISLFGRPELIETLSAHAADIVPEGCSPDFSPEYGFAAVHPGRDFRDNKGTTMETLVTHGVDRLVHIGNSGSDWVPKETGVEVMFVGGKDQRIKTYMRENAACISNLPTLAGVVDIMKQIE